MVGICLLALSGFNIAMQYNQNEVWIGITLAIGGGAGLAFLPLMNELIVETTYPVGPATSTGIPNWLSGSFGGALVALSSLVPLSDLDEYPNSVCRDGETQDLSWYISIVTGIGLIYYLFFVYFYRKIDHEFYHYNRYKLCDKFHRNLMQDVTN